MGSENKPRFRSNWLTWTVDRQNRSFRVYVVEPRIYKPTSHAAIFEAAFRWLVAPDQTSQARVESRDVHTRSRRLPQRKQFDLLTFPEAFLAVETLLEHIQAVNASPLCLKGCIHVGLRPNATSDKATHLFKIAEIETLIERLKEIPLLHQPDLIAFENWLDDQDSDHRFNLACLFATDAEGQIRICLHPKLVSSKYEESALPENDMTEANLLSLVTLRPANKSLSLITIQPLICSDALNLPTDRHNNHPIPAITSHRAELDNEVWADHVDIVSLTTATPTKKVKISSSSESDSAAGDAHKYEWKQEFRDAFKRAAADDSCSRHHFAAFVMSNYYQLPRANAPDPGGLSGTFIPLPLYGDPFNHPRVSDRMSVFGHFKDCPANGDPPEHEDQRWTSATSQIKTSAERTGLGYIVALDPSTQQSETSAIMFGFTLSRLPRDTNRWQRRGGIVNISVMNARSSKKSGESKLEFVDPEQS